MYQKSIKKGEDSGYVLGWNYVIIIMGPKYKLGTSNTEVSVFYNVIETQNE